MKPEPENEIKEQTPAEDAAEKAADSAEKIGEQAGAAKAARQPVRAAKPVSILLSVVLAFALICSCTFGVLRATLSPEGISRIISAALGSGILAEAPGGYELADASPKSESPSDVIAGMKTEDIVDQAYKLGLDELFEDYGITRENMGELIENSTFREFAEENAGEIVSNYLATGSVAEAVDPDLLVDFVRDNEETIYKVTGHRVTEEQYKALRERVPEVLGKVDSTTVGSVKDKLGFDVSAVTAAVAKLTSPVGYIASIAAAVLAAVIIFALHKFLLGRSLSYVAIPALVVGILFAAVAGVLYLVGGSILNGALVSVFGAVNVSIITRAAALAAAGIVLLIVRVPLKKHNI